MYGLPECHGHGYPRLELVHFIHASWLLNTICILLWSYRKRRKLQLAFLLCTLESAYYETISPICVLNTTSVVQLVATTRWIKNSKTSLWCTRRYRLFYLISMHLIIHTYDACVQYYYMHPFYVKFKMLWCL